MASVTEQLAKTDSSDSQVCDDGIAIIGIGCRFPGGADDCQSYWDLLKNGTDAISETPADRWSLQKFYSANTAVPGKTQSKWGGYVDGIDQFDPQLFGISPREAASMDPQQRMLLEVTWRALEDAGVAPAGGLATVPALEIGQHVWVQALLDGSDS